jgi:hypothetical protein
MKLSTSNIAASFAPTPLKLSLAAFVIVGACSAPTEAAPPPEAKPPSGQLAFPGAIGHGAASKGGRGGRIIPVETLADSGPGSLRACLEASGPRTCIFRVSGVIRFTDRPPVIRNPYLTIAGHTAPGGGITLAHSGGASARTPLLIKNTHDVVVRHIRVRLDRIGERRGSEDGFTVENSDNVILDHISGSWARDEIVNGYGDNDRVTISYSIFAEGIPRHDKCALLGSDPQDPQRLSFIGNLCAHNGDRNPDINFPPGSCVEVINNVLYNAQSQFAEVWEKFGGTTVAIVGNVFKAGPNTGKAAIGIARNTIGSTGAAAVYLWGNRFDGSFEHVSPLVTGVATETPPCPLTITAMPAEKAYETVLLTAGAFPRDPVDARVVATVRKRAGRIVNQPGTIPPVIGGEAYADTDRDGMDDAWEKGQRMDQRRFDAWADADKDGVANFEEFLDYSHRRLVGGAK